MKKETTHISECGSDRTLCGLPKINYLALFLWMDVNCKNCQKVWDSQDSCTEVTKKDHGGKLSFKEKQG